MFGREETEKVRKRVSGLFAGAVHRVQRVFRSVIQVGAFLARCLAMAASVVKWLLRRLARIAHWWFLVFASAVRRFDKHDGVMRSAAISYFGLISFFPLVLVLITFSSYFLEATAVQQQVLGFVEVNAPTAVELIEGNMTQILRYRNTVGLLAIVAFFWSASAVFSSIDRSLNRIWDVQVLRPYWRSKLIAILVIIAIGFLSSLSFIITAIVSFVRHVILPFLAFQWGVSLGPWNVVVVIIPYLSSILLFAAIYWIFPHMNVRFLDIWPGALVAGLVWEQAKRLFTDYVTTFGRYNLVYGSVGTIIALMVWFYLTALILLMGAEISASYSRARRHLKN